MFKKRILRISIIVAAMLILVAVSVYPYVRTYPIGEVGEIESEQRKYRHHGINEGEYELGAFYVLENRGDPASRVIGINFARFQAESREGLPIRVPEEYSSIDRNR